MKRFLFTLTVAVATLSLPLAAQGPPAQTADAEVEIFDLELMLVPLTVAELEVEVAAWMQLLRARAQEVSNAQIEEARLEGDEQAAKAEEVVALREQRVALEDRITAVIAALRDKGGQVEEYETYVSAVANFGVVVDLTEPSAAWTAITTWIQSSEGGVRWGSNMLLFLATLLAFRILSAVLSRVVRRAVNSFGNTPELLGKFFVNMVRRITMFIGIVVALSMLGIDIGPLVAGIGAAGLVLGFALQGTLSNFASGIMILMHRPYDIGNYVKVAGVAGTVHAMNLVSTSLRTSDNQTVVVPNNAIWSDIITNVSANATRRVDLTFGIGYSDDMDVAQRAMESVLENHPLVLKDPKPTVMVLELADSSVNFICRSWCKSGDFGTVKSELQRMVKERFDQEGISIPFPQQDVHMHQATPA